MRVGARRAVFVIAGLISNFWGVSSSPTLCAPGAHWQISYTNQLIFIHVSKTGGTSVETSALFADRRAALGPIGGHHKMLDHPTGSPGCRGYHSFAFVRHPCERLRSLWAYYSEGLGNAGDKAWVASHVTPRAVLNFSTFVLEADRPPSTVKAWQWEHHHHMQTQVGMLLGTDGAVAVQQVFEITRWDESVDALDREVNSLASVAARAAARKEVARLGVAVALHVDVKHLHHAHKLASNHNRGTCAQDLTPAAWAALVRMYHLDFCALGYSTARGASTYVPALNDLAPSHITARLQACRGAAAFERNTSQRSIFVSNERTTKRTRRAKPDRQSAPCTMHTYIDWQALGGSAAQKADNAEILASWRAAWESSGWRTRVLSERDAMLHADYAELKRAFVALPTVNKKECECSRAGEHIF